MSRTDFIGYEKLKGKVPSFTIPLDVGDRTYVLNCTLVNKHGRRSLVGRLQSLKQTDCCKPDSAEIPTEE